MSEFTSRTQKDIAELYQSIYDKQEKDSTEYILQERDAILNEECVEEEVNIEDDLDKLVNYLVSSGHVITEDQAINIIPSMSDSWMEYIIEQGPTGVEVARKRDQAAKKADNDINNFFSGELEAARKRDQAAKTASQGPTQVGISAKGTPERQKLEKQIRDANINRRSMEPGAFTISDKGKAQAAANRDEYHKNRAAQQASAPKPAPKSDASASTSTSNTTTSGQSTQTKPSNVISAINTAGNKQKVTVGRKYAATLGGKAGNVTYDASGKRTWKELEKTKSASTSPAPKVQTAPKAQTAPAPKPTTVVKKPVPSAKAAWLHKTRNSPAARSGAFTDNQRWSLQQKHRAWKARRK